jgi:hypothetical protein
MKEPLKRIRSQVRKVFLKTGVYSSLNEQWDNSELTARLVRIDEDIEKEINSIKLDELTLRDGVRHVLRLLDEQNTHAKTAEQVREYTDHAIACIRKMVAEKP